jgi:capsular exopolysaccharide synthesis family protein
MALWGGRTKGTTAVDTQRETALATGGNREGGLLAGDPSAAEPREWLFPGSDELYRGLYTRVTHDRPEVLAITSSASGEGKTTTAVGLAITVAQDFPSERVLLVEADLDRPVLADDFGVDRAPGLVDCLLDDQSLMNAYRPTFLPNLHVVPAGVQIQGAGRLLRSSQMATAVQMMKRTYDLVILDCPAVLVNSDAVAMSDLADGTVFVVRSGVATASLVHQALARLHEAKLRGVVLNGHGSVVPGWLRRLCGL